ncbi:ADP-ribosylglycohydrolase family protein [Streptomyces sp. FIT100]|uniref:ADP-ribosylglycohydrolase family protein n=1 Tax=Streptomyces sp. FIT100 TaxID=2837956 RepID=UPI0028BE735D|nr:ADP-ribosylglycohydrolase family protein [Streptomyces sp. FIT100]
MGLASGPPGGRRAASALNRATRIVCHTGRWGRQSGRRDYPGGVACQTAARGTSGDRGPGSGVRLGGRGGGHARPPSTTGVGAVRRRPDHAAGAEGSDRPCGANPDPRDTAGADAVPLCQRDPVNECLRAALDKVTDALREPDIGQDPCEVVGAGWIAEEALATALYCFLVVRGDARAAIARGAHSSGDSDSIAALAGAFAGAKNGPKYWLPEWIEVLEYRDRLSALARAWD